LVLAGLCDGVFAADEPAKKDEPAAEMPPDNGWQQSQLPKDALDPKVLSDRQPLKEPLENPEEFAAFVRVLAYAKTVSQELLARHARLGVSYETLSDDKQRKDFFGQLIRVSGKLARPIREETAPAALKGKLKDGVYYSAWLTVEGSDDKAVQVLFTDLPEGLTVGERGDYKVEANGYLFKLIEYTVGKDRDGVMVYEKKYAPLLVGRTLAVLEETPPVVVDESDEARVRLNKDSKEWEAVKDEKPLGGNENEEEYRAYNLVVKHARGISPEDLKKYAKKDVVYADLISDLRRQFLREDIAVEDGTLVRLREREPTGRLKATTDIKKLYEGWISKDGNLYTVVFTELPEGLKPGERINHKVSFYGYYFKLHAYETKEKNEKNENVWYRAPLLIGRTIEVKDPDPSYWELANPVIPFILMLLGVVAAIVLCLLAWYRHNDRKIKAQAIEAMTRHNPFDEQRDVPPPIEPGSGWNRLEDA